MNAITQVDRGDVRNDGMMNVLGILASQRSGFGGAIGSAFYNHDSIYEADGLAQTIVDKPAEDALANGFEIEGDEQRDIINEFDRLDAIPVLIDSLRWMRLYGGGAVLMLIDDGMPLTEPLNLDRVNRLDDLIPYAAPAIFPTSARYNDPTKKNYGWPMIYELRPSQGLPFMVHESRMVKLGGKPMPGNRTSRTGLPWVGRSALDACYAAVKRYNDGLFLSKGILERKTQLVHKMSDLGGMLAQGLDEVVAKRINIADSARNIFNMLAVDALDDIVLADTQVAGIDSLIRDFRIDICSKSQMPMAVLFGEQAPGLNANAEGENTIYSKLLEGIQRSNIGPAVELLARVIWAQKALPRKEPERWTLKFNSPITPRASELAELEQKKAQARKTNVEAVVAALDSRVLLPEEGRQAMALALPDLNLDVTLDVTEAFLPDDVDAGGSESDGR